MNVNATKLLEALQKSDKRTLGRLARLRAVVPRTTIEGHKRGQVPMLRHAIVYETEFGFRPRDWLVEVKP